MFNINTRIYMIYHILTLCYVRKLQFINKYLIDKILKVKQNNLSYMQKLQVGVICNGHKSANA